MQKSKKFFTFLLIFCFAILMAGCVGPDDDQGLTDDRDLEDRDRDEGDEEPEFDPAWSSQIVDDAGWVGIDPALALDQNARPHISYYDQGNRDLKYAFLGKTWQVETVDSEGDIGEASGIAVDSQNRPHISYVDVTTGALRYATKTQNGWQIERVDTPPQGQVRSTSLALDSQGYPHIAYNVDVQDGKDSLKYAQWDGAQWQIEVVASQGTDAQFVLDQNDNPHIAFKAEAGGKEQTFYATRKNGKWWQESIDPETKAGGDCDVAVDSQGNPHIVYHDYGKAAIKYARWGGASWQITTIDEDAGSAEGLRMDLDSNDAPYIVYADQPQEKLVCAFLGGETWQYEIINPMGIPAIVVLEPGRVFVAHNRVSETHPREIIPDYQGKAKEIEILMFSERREIYYK